MSRQTASRLMSGLIAVLTGIGTVIMLTNNKEGILTVYGAENLKFFTVESNLLIGIVHLLSLFLYDASGQERRLWLDRLTSGLQKSDLIIIAARPSMGKTAFALNIAVNAAKTGGKVGYIHMRAMGAEDLDMFLMKMHTEVYDKDALILDLRYNNGGNVHKEVIDFLRGQSHFEWSYRDFPRTSHPNVTLVDVPMMDISSTYIRDQIRQGHDVRFLLTEPVYQYLTEMHFYEK